MSINCGLRRRVLYFDMIERMAIDFELTKGEYWGGAQIDFYTYLIYTIVWGFFGMDHLLLRSPITFLCKLLIPTLGLWWFFDIIQACFYWERIKLYGIAFPWVIKNILGPSSNLGRGMFYDAIDKNEGKKEVIVTDKLVEEFTANLVSKNNIESTSIKSSELKEKDIIGSFFNEYRIKTAPDTIPSPESYVRYAWYTLIWSFVPILGNIPLVKMFFKEDDAQLMFGVKGVLDWLQFIKNMFVAISEWGIADFTRPLFSPRVLFEEGAYRPNDYGDYSYGSSSIHLGKEPPPKKARKDPPVGSWASVASKMASMNPAVAAGLAAANAAREKVAAANAAAAGGIPAGLPGLSGGIPTLPGGLPVVPTLPGIQSLPSVPSLPGGLHLPGAAANPVTTNPIQKGGGYIQDDSEPSSLTSALVFGVGVLAASGYVLQTFNKSIATVRNVRPNDTPPNARAV